MLDHADQRFYTSQFGRFMSADRSHLNVGLDVSGSWNKYAYVLGDPINGYDPTGRSCQLVDDGSGNFILNCSDPDGGGGTSGGSSSGTACTDERSRLANADCFGGGGQGGNPGKIPTLAEANASQQKQFQKAMAAAIGLIQKQGTQCNSLFKGQTGVNDLESAFWDYGPLTVNAGPGAAAQTLTNLNTVIINSSGWFFNPIQSGPNGTTLNYGASLGLSGTNLQAFVILHELGHLMGIYGATDNDGSGPNAVANQNANNTLVLQDCFGKQYNPGQ